MSDTSKRIRAVLAGADDDLCQIIAESAKAGDLPGVDTALSIASRIRELVKAIEPTPEELPLKPELDSSRASTGSGSGSRRKRGYPEFFLENGNLYRVGWSKKKKRQYKHRASKEVFYKTIEAISALSKAGKSLFTAEEIIKELNGVGVSPVPSYQVYVVLGYLRHQQYVHQVGREGYQIPDNVSLKDIRIGES